MTWTTCGRARPRREQPSTTFWRRRPGNRRAGGGDRERRRWVSRPGNWLGQAWVRDRAFARDGRLMGQCRTRRTRTRRLLPVPPGCCPPSPGGSRRAGSPTTTQLIEIRVPDGTVHPIWMAPPASWPRRSTSFKPARSEGGKGLTAEDRQRGDSLLQAHPRARFFAPSQVLPLWGCEQTGQRNRSP
jgi:hypothetical protein